MKQFIGVDIGGTTVKVGYIDENGTIINKYEVKTDKTNCGENILRDISNSIVVYMNENNINEKDILGIGVGIPGPVVNNVVTLCANLGWKNKNVEKDFLKVLPFKTKINCANDANVAALGEMWKGNDSDCKSAIMITLGTGVGGGVIVDGKAIDGINGCGGEIGHAKIDFKYDFNCNCGSTGCLETVTSATGVVNLAKFKLKTDDSILLNIKDFTCKDVFDSALKGDKVSLEVVDEVCSYLGQMCSILATTTNPELFIIGGGVSKAGKFLIDGITKYYKKYSFVAIKDTPIIVATLGNDAGMIGAAYLVK